MEYENYVFLPLSSQNTDFSIIGIVCFIIIYTSKSSICFSFSLLAVLNSIPTFLVVVRGHVHPAAARITDAPGDFGIAHPEADITLGLDGDVAHPETNIHVLVVACCEGASRSPSEARAS